MKGLALVLALLPLAASAATITVNATADNTTAGDGQCALREAIANVNAAADTSSGDCTAGSGAGDTITFSLALPATIKLAAPSYGELAIARDLTIVGPGRGLLAIDGRHKTRVFHITGGSTAMSDLTIRNGQIVSDTANGGGVAVDSGTTLQITNSTLTGNKAIGIDGAPGVGGGISIFGTATLTNCTVSGNRAVGTGQGGGDGYGGGIEIAGTATLINCTLSSNRAVGISGGQDQGDGSGFSGGIDIGFMGTATLTNCTLSGNSAVGTGGGYGDGGGIGIGGTATLTNCTLSGNRAIGGGGGFGSGGGISGGTATLTNCTLSGNRAIGYGSGGGISGGYSITLINTIVANSGQVGNCSDPVTSGGHNLSSDPTCFTGGGTDLLNTRPGLGALRKYGGPTQSLALCTGSSVPAATCTAASPAIDAGDDSVTGPPANLTTDQRGLPRLSGAHIDIGAYEVQQ